MTAPTSNALPPSPLASPSSHSRASSWWSTVASAASASWSRLPPLLAVAGSSPSRPPPSPSPKHHDQRQSSPPLPNLSDNDENDHNDDDDDDELSWQVVLTNHGQASSIDGSSCPLVMPESRFVQLPQLQPIHGLLPFDEADESGSETDDDDDDGDGDQYVTRTLASPDAPPFAVAAIAAASPLVSPSIPAAGHEPMLVATVDAHALDQEKDSQLDDDAVGSTSSDEDDEDDEDEVEMSIDQLDLLLSQTRSPHSNSNNNNNNMDPTLTASHPSSPSPSPSPLPLPSPPPPSTSLSPIDSGILVPIPTWAWHLILNPNADTTPVDPPKPPIAKKSKTRIAKTSTMDLRRVARDAISAHGCMGRFQRQHGPQPAGAAHKRHAAVAVVAGGGKRGAGKSAV